MVMKYALNEREIIIQKKHREEAEKKMKNALKERDDAVNKSKNAIADKLKLQQLADSRVSITYLYISKYLAPVLSFKPQGQLVLQLDISPCYAV